MSTTAQQLETSPLTLTKTDPNSPVLKVTGRDTIVITAGTNFDGRLFQDDQQVLMSDGDLEVGADYGVICHRSGAVHAIKIATSLPDICFAGFHFAPGGNAPARAGGDEIPAINPRSLWDLKFRPACPDVRGMTLTQRFGLTFWSDIYLLGQDRHINGTSKFGVTIADGNAPPVNPATGKKFKGLDYYTAVAVMSHHGKQLMGSDEFRAFAYGVTEKTSCDRDPKITGLDAPHTSQDGGMQAAGNMLTWGHDGDPDAPRASLFGGSWLNGSGAGSRCAYVDYWPGHSRENLGARGRSDHLQLV
jgi:hypothetical protein